MRISTAVVAVILFCMPVLLYAQNIRTITGKVVGAGSEPLIGNVLVLSAPDSGLIKGGSFMNGAFEIAGIDRKEVWLKLTSLQFRDTVIHVRYTGRPQVDLGSITIRESKYGLHEVQVTGRMPSVKQTASGNTEVNVANTILATSSSVEEILSRLPNVVILEGQITVQGKGEAIIYLNGRLINSERMAAIPTSQIVKIEIISNPSSKYDAEGKAVINIITKGNVDEGIMGTVSQHIANTSFAGTNTNTFLDLSYRKNKLSMIGNYGLQLGKGRELLFTTRTRSAADEYLRSELTTDWRRKYNSYMNYGLGLQYDFSAKTNVSLGYSGNRDDLGGSVNSSNRITTKTDNSFYTSSIAKNDVRYNHSVIFNLNSTIDTLGSAFFAGAQYNYYNGAIRDSISESSIVNGSTGGRFLRNNVDHRLSITSVQADYTKMFAADRKLETGAKFSHVSTGSGTDFLIAGKDREEFKPDTGLSSTYRYAEQIAAAYVSFSTRIRRRINFNAGVRGEWTRYELNTTLNGGQTIRDNYFNLFPNVLVSVPVFGGWTVRGAYVARITRPRYQSLNPFVVYQDPLTTIEGNPGLVPEKTHAFELGAMYGKYDLKVGYTYTQDLLSASALSGRTPNSYVLKPINLHRKDAYFISLSRSLDLKWWNSVNTASLIYSTTVDNKYAFIQNRPRPQIYLYTNNTFRVRNLFRLLLLASYSGDKYYGIWYEKMRYNLTLGIEKSFFNNALKTSFTANDIFHQDLSSGNYSVGRTDIYYHRSYNSNYFKLVVAYTFGGLKQSVYRNKAAAQAESSRVD